MVYSLIRVKDSFLARELYLRLQDEEASFPELASEYSEGSERTTQGIIGPCSLLQAHPSLAEKLRTATLGKVVEPFNVAEWWLILRLEATNKQDSLLRWGEPMAYELFEQGIDEAVTEKLRELQSTSSSSDS